MESGLPEWRLAVVIVAMIVLTYLSLRPETWSQSSGPAITRSGE